MPSNSALWQGISSLLPGRWALGAGTEGILAAVRYDSGLALFSVPARERSRWPQEC
ncbi:hypothetical protein [Streptomyces chartreusis]